MAVEDCKQADNSHCGRRGGAHVQSDDSTEHDDGKRDAGFNERYVDTGHAERAAEGHDKHEGRWHGPDGAAAKLEGEHADHDHGQDVIEAGHRMAETMDKACRLADAGMGIGSCRKRCGGKRKDAALED